MLTGLVIFALSILGAAGVYFLMPGNGASLSDQLKGRLGALLSMLTVAGALGGLLIYVNQIASHNMPNWFMYVFGAMAIGFAIRVITHTRPVYSALYFIMVVLSVAGMFLLLEAEFLAIAMIIIYGGAILVTYMFVIMLATLPQREGEEFTGASYDRKAFEPLIATFCGFALLAVLCSVLFASTTTALGTGGSQIGMTELQPNEKLASVRGKKALEAVPGRLDSQRLENVLRTNDIIEIHEEVRRVPQLNEQKSYDDDATIVIGSTISQQEREIPLTDDIAELLISNTDHVGIALFRGHTLGIEIAGVILLLAMVGAIVISRKRVAEEDDHEDEFPRG